ncbi:phosphatidic acid phosphatase type 2/haloperoxidase [Aspergillus pseudotamarii]|uniref:Phosphatidic acid phosphatase type 2/haloperoxidase n=1 Tax=Aspergillus pseudotamarii TaxID=132259 RepID=A0A5N6SUN4_ASPPS|nr:phosphatidic acid phosphatase type 2/haloperoxidase [Aspergillus pseudotamarii]KAE8138396.1 phosphatidic acid phosphatase type 2/haloperoxidase [Aspergillus pseudotamarii]
MPHIEKPTHRMGLQNVNIPTAKRYLPLLISYIMDWVFIIGIALIGYGFHKVTPNHRPFTLTDPSISFPYTTHETVSTAVLVVVGLIIPAVIIVLVTLVIMPGVWNWRVKIWEWNAGWLGLALAVAGAFMATEGLKDLYGRPRPDLLARCDPDLGNIGAYVVGGLGGKVEGAPRVVSWEICRNTGKELVVDGFVSFPSGHSSFAFAGLTYLSLWLCAKLSIGFPYLAHSPFGQDLRGQKRETIRNLGAAPPVLLVILAFVPMAVAFFISASRWFDFRHHGFDIIFGSVMGMVFAWGAFRLYHLPIMRGGGWAWGVRSRRHAFFKGVGLPSHIGGDNWSSVKDIPQSDERAAGQDIDLESGPRNLAE